jgi:hypothetical protein
MIIQLCVNVMHIVQKHKDYRLNIFVGAHMTKANLIFLYLWNFISYSEGNFIMNSSFHSLLSSVRYLYHERAGPSDCAVWGVRIERLDAETVGLNPAWGIFVLLRLIIIVHYIVSSEFTKLWGALPVGGRVVCIRDIFILNKIWAEDKIYILVGTLLGWNNLLLIQYKYWLWTISSTFCLRPKLEKYVIH